MHPVYALTYDGCCGALYGVERGGATTAAIFIYMRRGALLLNKYLSERCSGRSALSVENERKFNEMHPPNTPTPIPSGEMGNSAE